MGVALLLLLYHYSVFT